MVANAGKSRCDIYHHDVWVAFVISTPLIFVCSEPIGISRLNDLMRDLGSPQSQTQRMRPGEYGVRAAQATAFFKQESN